MRRRPNGPQTRWLASTGSLPADELGSLVESLGLGLVKLLAFFVPAADRLETVAPVLGWLFVLVVGGLVLTCVRSLVRR